MPEIKGARDLQCRTQWFSQLVKKSRKRWWTTSVLPTCFKGEFCSVSTDSSNFFFRVKNYPAEGDTTRSYRSVSMEDRCKWMPLLTITWTLRIIDHYSERPIWFFLPNRAFQLSLYFKKVFKSAETFPYNSSILKAFALHLDLRWTTQICRSLFGQFKIRHVFGVPRCHHNIRQNPYRIKDLIDNSKKLSWSVVTRKVDVMTCHPECFSFWTKFPVPKVLRWALNCLDDVVDNLFLRNLSSTGWSIE